MRPSHKAFSAGVLDSSRAGLLQTPKPLFQEHPNPVLRLLPFTEVIPIRPLLCIPKKGKGISMSTKLYVGNLAFQTTSQELQELFARPARLNQQRSSKTATRAVHGLWLRRNVHQRGRRSSHSQFNGKEVNGRALNVNEAKPRENRGGGGGRGFGGGGGGRGGYGGGGNGGGGGYGQKREPRW